MSTNSRFARGSGVYKCHSCGKQTRETGSGESDLELCVSCYEYGGWENTHSDEGHGPDYEHHKGELGMADCPICQGAKDPAEKS